LLLLSDAQMNSGDESDDFVEHNSNRAQRRFKVLQRQHTPGHTAATASQKKRKTPASAPISSKRSAATPRSIKLFGSTPKGPAKSLERSPAPTSCGSRRAADAKEQQHAPQQQQQQQFNIHPNSSPAAGEPLPMPSCSTAAGDAQDGTAAAGVAACLPSTCQQQQAEQPDQEHVKLAQPGGFDTRPEHLAHQNSCRYTEAEVTVGIKAAAAEAVEAGGPLTALVAADQHAPAGAACPVCRSSLADISCTEAGQAAHVNACLDAATAADEADLPGAMEASSPAAAAAAEGGRQEQQQQQPEVIKVDAEDDVTAW
jgi:hypothetical protein